MHNLHAKKSLGQNFLHYPKALTALISLVHKQKLSNILEIGPGKGALTRALLEKTNCTVHVVELDQRMCEFLQETFTEYVENKRLFIHHADILDINPDDIFKGNHYGIVGNLPFYITGAIIKKFLTHTYYPTYMGIIIQKEVADRIVANDGKESILSLSVKIFGIPKSLLKIPKKYFTPIPKVDAGLVSITDIHQNRSTHWYTTFFNLVKQGFAHKRKKLTTNINDQQIKDFLHHHNLSANIRAEDMSCDQWIQLTDYFLAQTEK